MSVKEGSFLFWIGYVIFLIGVFFQVQYQVNTYGTLLSGNIIQLHWSLLLFIGIIPSIIGLVNVYKGGDK